jgi:hypothetical protein
MGLPPKRDENSHMPDSDPLRSAAAHRNVPIRQVSGAGRIRATFDAAILATRCQHQNVIMVRNPLEVAIR